MWKHKKESKVEEEKKRQSDEMKEKYCKEKLWRKAKWNGNADEDAIQCCVLQ